MRLKFLLLTLICILTFAGESFAQRSTITANYRTSAQGPPSSCSSSSKNTSWYFVANDGIYQCINNVPVKQGVGGGSGGSSVETVVTTEQGLTDTLSAAAGSPTLRVSVKANNSITVNTAKTFPSNVTTTFANNAKFNKGNGGTIKFEGVGLTEAELKSQSVLFSGFAAGEVQFTGAEYPKEINAEIFDGANPYERWERASTAFTDKFVKIRLNKSGNVPNMMRVRAKQTMYGEGIVLSDTRSSTVYDQDAMILMYSDTSLIGASPQSFRINEMVRSSYALTDPIALVRTATYTNDEGNQLHLPTNNVTVRGIGFYGNRALPGRNDAVGAAQLGNGRNLAIEHCYFEGVHGYSATIGGFTSGVGLPNGTVNTSTGGGVHTVTWVSGTKFPALLIGEEVVIAGLKYQVLTRPTDTTMTINRSAGTLTGATIKTEFFAEDARITHNTARFVHVQPFVFYSVKRGELAHNFVGDYGSESSVSGAAIDLEPNHTDDRLEYINVHHNIIDFSTNRLPNTGINAVSASSNHPIRFLRITDNIIIGGREEGSAMVYPLYDPAGTGAIIGNNLTIGIQAHGLEYSTISNNTISLGSTAGIVVDNSSKISIDNNKIFDSGHNGTAIRIGNVYESAISNNRITKATRANIGTTTISEVPTTAIATTTANSITISGGATFLYHWYKNQTAKIGATDIVFGTVSDLTTAALVTGTSATNAILTLPGNTNIYSNNLGASVLLASNSKSTVEGGGGGAASSGYPVTILARQSGANTVTDLARQDPVTVGAALPAVGDSYTIKAYGTFGANTNATKRIRLYDEVTVDLMFDSGLLAANGGGWSLETKLIKLPAGETYQRIQWITTFIGGGVIQTQSKTLDRLNNDPIKPFISGAGTAVGDITLSSFKASKD